MPRREILATRYGEMLDMLNCMAIYKGAPPAKRKKTWGFDEALNLR